MIALASLGLGSVQLAILAVLGAISAIDAGVALVNRGVTLFVGPVPLPGLELRDGIPESLRTLVAVPTFLTTPEDIAEQVERLEIHHLASPEGDLHFALLSDWIDADVDRAEGDAELVAIARDGIERLNRRYGPAPAGPRFLLLHRRRVWNESERRWIGWERKRGKLHELNRLLRGARDTTFMDMGGAAPSPPQDVRYVVTLDSDTRLPRDTIRRLIGKMAHPLNRPRLDAERSAIVEGYGVLQPRVTPSLPNGGEGSLFQRVFSSSSGIDPYAAAVSDVYQDMFCEGSYAGKGIYDVDAFESALSGRTPNSTLLSHDLFEGTFARAGFASDVEVVDDFPSRYDVSARRHHRWARGDWQLLPWILGFAGEGGRKSGVRDAASADRSLEDDRQPAPDAQRARGPSGVGGRLDASARTRARLDDVRARDRYSAKSHTCDLGYSGPPSGRGAVWAFASAWGGSPPRCDIVSVEHYVSCGSGLVDGRRHRADALAAFRQPPTSARVDARGAGCGGKASRSPGVRRPNVGSVCPRRRWRLLLTLLFGHGGWPIATPFVVLWVISPAVARYVSLPPRASMRRRRFRRPNHWACVRLRAAPGGSSKCL